MNLLEFQNLYPDEVSCKRKWREIREKEGRLRCDVYITISACGHSF